MATPDEIQEQLKINSTGVAGDSFIWKALGYLGRPASAVTGALVGPTEQAGNRFMKGLSGEQTYGGADIIKAFGGDPKTALGGYAAPILDVVNPLDPLMYVGGAGALTKAGKAARASGELAKGAEAFGLGQRSLLSFAGHNVIPGAVAEPIVSGLGKAADAVHLFDNPVSQKLSAMFTKTGELKAAGLDNAAGHQYLDAVAAGESAKNQALADMGPHVDQLNRLSSNKQYDSLFTPGERRSVAQHGADISDAVKSGEISESEALQRIQNDPALTKAYESYDTLKGLAQKHLIGTDANDQLAAMLAKDKWHIPHASVEPADMAGTYDEIPAIKAIKGTQADHSINRDLLAASEQNVINEHILEPNADDPTKALRLPAAKIANEAQTFGYRAQRLARQVADKVAATRLVEDLDRQGLAPLLKDHPEYLNDPKWKVVNGGKFAGEEARFIPAEISQAADKYNDMTRQPTIGMFGQLLKNVTDFWKRNALLSPGWVSRNFVTGVVRNAEEGLGFLPWQIGHTGDMYAKSAQIVGDGMKNLKHGAAPESGQVVFRLGKTAENPEGVAVASGDLWKQWRARGWGGSQPGELETGFIQSETKAGEGKAKTIGEKINALMDTPSMLNPYHAIRTASGSAEELNRFALAMHAIDETLKAGGTLERGFEHATERVLKAQFSYSAGSYTKFENALSKGAFPFYKWYRNNMPYEMVNMIQHPGQYMPIARAYYNAYRNQDVDPADTPEWLRQDVAIPIGPNAKGDMTYFDPSGYLPQMDPMNAFNALFGAKKPGMDRTHEMLNYASGFLNPVIKQGAEQALNRNSYSGQELANKPAEMLGIPINARTKNLADLFPPLGQVNRLNPLGLFTQIGQQTGAIPDTGERIGMNEPPQSGRWARSLLGFKEYTPDAGSANRTRKQWAKKAKEYQGYARRAKSDAERNYYMGLADEAQQNL